MPTIEISAEQQAYISALRDELADTVTYGHVRELDAVQYLIDHHRDDGDLDVEIDPDIEAKLDEVEPDGGAVTQSSEAGDDAGGPQDGGGGSAETSENSGGAGTSTGGSVDDTVAALQGAGPGDQRGSSGGAGDDGGETVSSTSADTVDDAGDDKVSQMMSLLDDHDDKWREAGGGDARYEVELPDGDTEPAQTKDDVRALLFKHY